MSLAGRLTQMYPAQAATHMLLSEAYMQKAKNAYRVDGESVIKWERNALDAAIHASRQSPRATKGRHTLSVRTAAPDWISWS